MLLNDESAEGGRFNLFFEEQKLTAFKNYRLQLLLETAIDAAHI